jgi:signal transduction histidine kinase
MFSSISHELRTPINAFSNAIEIIKFCSKKIQENFITGRTLDAKMLTLIDKNTEIASVSSNLLLNLTEDILDFAKIEAGIFTLNPSKFLIQTFIGDIRFIFDHQWRAKGINFIIEWDDELLQSQFTSDSGRIKQILINLISNSFKFTNHGYIKVVITSFIKRGFEWNRRFLKFKVEDTGIGISEEDQSHLFKMFGIAHKPRDDFKMRGTGLGLTITRKLVKLLGGKIILKSEVDKGTTVSFNVKEAKPIDDHPFELSPTHIRDPSEFPNREKSINMKMLTSRGCFHEEKNPFTMKI